MMKRNVFSREEFNKSTIADGNKRTTSPRFYYFPYSINHKASTGHVSWMLFDRYLSHHPNTIGGATRKETGVSSIQLPNEKEPRTRKQRAYSSRFATFKEDMEKYTMPLFTDINNLQTKGKSSVSQFIHHELSRSNSIYAINDITYMSSNGKAIENVKRSNCVTSSMRVLCAIIHNLPEIPPAFIQKHSIFENVGKFYPNFDSFIRSGELNDCEQVGHLAGIVRDLVWAQRGLPITARYGW